MSFIDIAGSDDTEISSNVASLELSDVTSLNRNTTLEATRINYLSVLSEFTQLLTKSESDQSYTDVITSPRRSSIPSEKRSFLISPSSSASSCVNLQQSKKQQTKMGGSGIGAGKTVPKQKPILALIPEQLMIKVCAWCDPAIVLQKNQIVTHGICEFHLKEVTTKTYEGKESKLIDRLDPVLLVQSVSLAIILFVFSTVLIWFRSVYL